MMKAGLAIVGVAALLLNAVPVAAQGAAQGAAQDVAAEGIAPSRWQPALPHAGQKARLLRWWAQWNDPVLLWLIESAQNTQSDLARGIKAIERVHDILPPERPAQRADTASWEASIAQAAHSGSVPSPGSARTDKDWHPARVAVAAETAEQFLAWLHCRHGGGDCVARLRALAILSGLPIGEVGERLLARGLQLPTVPTLREPRLRARLLEQRPDVAAAMLELEQARIEIGRAEAQRHPRLQLHGEVRSGQAGAPGPLAQLQVGGGSAASVASADSGMPAEIIGPALSVPPFDALRLQSVVEARQADYLAAASELRSRALEAARQVREALDQLAAAQRRAEAVRAGAEPAPSRLVDAWLEQAMAWIHLYRVVSGGWGTESPQRTGDQTENAARQTADRRP